MKTHVLINLRVKMQQNLSNKLLTKNKNYIAQYVNRCLYGIV